MEGAEDYPHSQQNAPCQQQADSTKFKFHHSYGRQVKHKASWNQFLHNLQKFRD